MIEYAAAAAEFAYVAVPAASGVAAILDEGWRNARALTKFFELREIDVADSDEAGSAAIVDGFHGFPRGPIVGGQADSLAGAVEQIGVYVFDLKMAERTGE